MLVGKSVVYGDETKPQFGRIIRAHANVVTLSPYQPINDDSTHYTDLLKTIKEEQTRVDNLVFQVDKLSGSLCTGSSVNAGNVELMILEWTQRRLEKIDSTHLQKLCSLSKPQEPTFTVLTAAATLILRSSSTPTWAATRRAISSGSFRDATQQMGTTQLPGDIYNYILDTFLSNSHFVSLTNETCDKGPLADVLLVKKWITAVMDFQRSRFGVNDHVELQQQLDACQLGLDAAQRRLSALREEMQLVQSGSLLVLNTQVRLTKSTSEIRSIVADSALHENGKYLNASECLNGLSQGLHSNRGPSSSLQVGAGPEQSGRLTDSQIARVDDIAAVLQELLAKHECLLNEYGSAQAQRNSLMDITQYLLVCIDDQKEEMVQVARALSSSRRESLVCKSLVRLLRNQSSQRSLVEKRGCEIEPDELISNTLEMSQLASSTEEFLRGLAASHCV